MFVSKWSASKVAVVLKTCLSTLAALLMLLEPASLLLGGPEDLAMPSLLLLSLASLSTAFGSIPPLDVVGSAPAAVGLRDLADAGVVVSGSAASCLAGRLWLLEFAVGAGRRAC